MSDTNSSVKDQDPMRHGRLVHAVFAVVDGNLVFVYRSLSKNRSRRICAELNARHGKPGISFVVGIIGRHEGSSPEWKAMEAELEAALAAPEPERSFEVIKVKRRKVAA